MARRASPLVRIVYIYIASCKLVLAGGYFRKFRGPSSPAHHERAARSFFQLLEFHFGPVERITARFHRLQPAGWIQRTTEQLATISRGRVAFLPPFFFSSLFPPFHPFFSSSQPAFTRVCFTERLFVAFFSLPHRAPHRAPIV